VNALRLGGGLALPLDHTPPGWGRWLLARRQILTIEQVEQGRQPEIAYYLCAGPPGPVDEDLIRVAGERRAIEECLQTAKTEVGLGQYQVRRCDAWYRHITLALLAYTYLAVTAAIAKKPDSGLILLTLGEIRRLLAHLTPRPVDHTLVWAWSRWRRRHQHRARTSHYRRRTGIPQQSAAGVLERGCSGVKGPHPVVLGAVDLWQPTAAAAP
jgi:hypothetical protein